MLAGDLPCPTETLPFGRTRESPEIVHVTKTPGPCSDPSPAQQPSSLGCLLRLARRAHTPRTRLTTELWLSQLLARAQSCLCVLGQGRPLARSIYKICAVPFSARREPISRSLPYSQVYQRTGLGPESGFLFLGGLSSHPHLGSWNCEVALLAGVPRC